MSPEAAALYVDSDDALGSRRGDVDDGFAVAALLLGARPIAALASVFGNTREPLAHGNLRQLAGLCGYRGPVLHGAAASGAESEASRFLAGYREPLRIVALGPLTNIAAALRLAPSAALRFTQIVLVGANASSRGRWPPLWPFEFNLVQDRAATRTVLGSAVPVTIVPLDVARRLRAGRAELARLDGALGEYLRRGAHRWLRRAAVLHLSRSFPVWDLLAALHVLEPALVECRQTCLRCHPDGRVELDAGDRPVRLVTGFDGAALWSRFVELVCRAATATADRAGP